MRPALLLVLGLLAGLAAHAETVRIQTAAGQTHEFRVELATTVRARAQGLKHRTRLAPDRGMLFVFPDERRAPFWMQDTLIPLDLIFIGGDGRVHEVYADAQPLDLELIAPARPARAVLEINGGLAGQLGIAAGDRVLHALFDNIPD
jgi:uncharacterized membrane protein (UPF0127 family)